MANLFSSFIGLCGMTQQEAADYLGISKKTISMKAIDMRKPKADEERKLLDLWSRISNLDVPLDDSYPQGARVRQVAMIEARDRLLPPDEGGLDVHHLVPR